MNDYYKILKISHLADSSVIKKAYRKLAGQYHPDKNKGSLLAEEKFKEITQAYTVLSNPKERENYDQQRKAFQQHSQPSDPPPFSHSTNFSSTAQKNSSAQTEKAPSLDAVIQLSITLEEAHSGCTKHIMFDKKLNSKVKNTKLSIHIPKGIEEGTKLRLKEQSHQMNSQKGDLLIKVKIKKHPLFLRKKNDLFMQLPLSVSDAILGKKMTIPTLTGQAHIDIQPGVYSGKLLKLREQGFYFDNDRSRGDFILEIKIDIPDQITEEEKQWFKEFKKKSTLPPSVAQFNIQARKLLLRRAG